VRNSTAKTEHVALFPIKLINNIKKSTPEIHDYEQKAKVKVDLGGVVNYRKLPKT